ncbi:hypothetical protein [uncultured Kushneria sp.]|uniref:hypothetical protein n=1 Tax=uncultured Kushneria sp. TaxID=905033 RepID=UPI002616DE44|nr:hypothetical protein [uncultured Kushneria sp.]
MEAAHHDTAMEETPCLLNHSVKPTRNIHNCTIPKENSDIKKAACPEACSFLQNLL